MHPDTFNLPPTEETTTPETVDAVDVEKEYFDKQFAVMMGSEIAAEAVRNAEFTEIVSSELEEVHLIGEALIAIRDKEAVILASSKNSGPMSRVVSLFKDII